MARLDARWDNFAHRGQAWDHFWQDSPTGETPPEPPATVRRYYRGRVAKAGAVSLSKQFYYVDE